MDVKVPPPPVERAGDSRPVDDIPVTVVVPAKNEQRNLSRCLAALSRFTEVIVVDSGSTDRTREIAREAGATLLNFRWDGGYPKKRNWVLLNQRFVNDWVLFLDADEVVDDCFCDAVDAAVASGRHDGYWLNYTNHFLGRKLHHGVPQRKLALFRVGRGLYERIDEERWSDLDMEVHEHPVVDGAIGEIETPIEHNDRSGLAVFIERHRNYALWEAERLLRIEEGSAPTKLTRRQRVKYANVARWWFPWVYFLYTYFVRLGFLDGRAGFSYAFYKLWYFETVRQLIAEHRRERARHASRADNNRN
jgi:glycosyltransferase involved in cell wall biosynthesis